MLIITNGDSAVGVIRAAGIDGEVLPWRDVLHDGPVPAGLDLDDLSEIRARFIADCGWESFEAVLENFRVRDARLRAFKDHEEVVLWFEHDLYDQLQLLQLLHWFSAQPPGQTQLSLICRDVFIAECSSESLIDSFHGRAPVTNVQLRLGALGWDAFRAPRPDALIDLAEADTRALPYLKSTLIRFFEEYPSTENGLSRNEQQIISLVASGIDRPVALFRAAQALEEAAYLGDMSFWSYVELLMQGSNPLLMCEDGTAFVSPSPPFPDKQFDAQRLQLTEAGQRVWRDEMDWLALSKLDKWLGGVHLQGHISWRWGRAACRLQVV